MYEIRSYQPADFPQVSSIYAQGIEDGTATFDQKTFDQNQFETEFFDRPRLCVLSPEQQIVGWSALKKVSTRECFSGVGEVSIYLHRDFRGKGLGGLLLKKLILMSEDSGFWTLQAGIFPENIASLTLHQKLGFRVVGHREKIGKQGDHWRDIVLLERPSPKF